MTGFPRPERRRWRGSAVRALGAALLALLLAGPAAWGQFSLGSQKPADKNAPVVFQADEVEYDEFSFKTKPGDLFVFFSDGILDARNAAGDLFGRQQVEEIVAENWEKSAGDVVQAIFQAVSAHTGGAESFDDETVVVIKVKAGSGAKK